ncbi:putative MFS family arabinose efflux permease [Pseudoduganella flava]|uniref:Putative MFS family arabinose efflux permease n=1 Tax=Pseudoduganella flava TaxID=871742 RepID=A0A562PHA9_9BURK|nr:YbfB/YjiJ family MFS transporter [Pseudoduganella flava]QGZ42612.1 YbfB/YjiJ family MFS transporter [Pseudoduganella flava]TWI43768.1 putative MFS family arabinose efflux permease [Pseudoduganella flava]
MPPSHEGTLPRHTGQPATPWFEICAGLSASLVAIGLSRFAYTPLIPALIGAHWFAASDVVYLGAANFAGYFAGALSARRLGARWSNRTMLRLMMALATASFAACAVPVSLLWYFAWRLVSGFAGAVVMVLVAQTVLPAVPPARRGLASGAIFMGIGAGIVASATLVPLLLAAGLAATWLGLAALAALLTALTWRAWPAYTHVAPPQAGGQPMPPAVRLLYGAYALVAVGLLGAAVFLVDYVARGLGQGSGTGAVYWLLYGAGALGGPMLYGLAADRIGAGRALRLGLVLSGAAALLLAWRPAAPALAAASVLLGAFTPGVVTLMIGRLHELLPGDAHAQHAAWGHATTVFALFQALAGYAFSYLFAYSGGRHHVIFLACAGAFGIALLLEACSATLRRRGPQGS